MRIMNKSLKLICAVIAVIFIGCTPYPNNPHLQSVSQSTGYRYSVVRPQPDKDKPFLILAFSGGGTRAAAFSFGLMEELRQVVYVAKDGSKRKLLDDVEIISSVSGGSFTAAYYTLFPERFFNDFPERFLYIDVQSALKWKLVNPYNWFRLASKDFSRIDM
ncbi:MAG: patatin-like phospholipase family protein, partial [Anaerolineales bacterium]